MTKSGSKKATILSSLTNISDMGITLYLNGKAATPEEIAVCCVNDSPKSMYMPDYVLDDKGKLKEIRYDKVILE